MEGGQKKIAIPMCGNLYGQRLRLITCSDRTVRVLVRDASPRVIRRLPRARVQILEDLPGDVLDNLF